MKTVIVDVNLRSDLESTFAGFEDCLDGVPEVWETVVCKWESGQPGVADVYAPGWVVSLDAEKELVKIIPLWGMFGSVDQTLNTI